MAGDDDVTSNRVARQLEERVREPERHLGRKTLEVEILREALDKSRSKTDLARAVAAGGRFPVKAVAETLGVARSNLIDRLASRAKPRRRYHKAQDAAVVLLITALVAARQPTARWRIGVILNRQLRQEGLAPVNHKRVYRIMRAHNLLLARRYSERPEYVHDSKVIVMRSNLRWCSDGFELTWLGMATSSAAPSSSTLMTARSNRRENDSPDRFLILLIPGTLWRTPASAVPTSAISCSRPSKLASAPAGHQRRSRC